MTITVWLRQRLDIFDLKVRANKTKDGRKHNDIYWNSGWAAGYKAAQRDARRAARPEEPCI